MLLPGSIAQINNLFSHPLMASSLHFLLFSFLLFFLAYQSEGKKTFRPTALVLPILRDSATQLYIASIHKRTPLLPVPFVIDLNGRFLWVSCDNQYSSTTYNAPLCHSSQCSIANTNSCRTCSSPSRPGCHNNTCGLIPKNPITHRSGPGELAEDVLSIQSTDGSNPGPYVTIPRFLFACAPAFLLQGGLFPKTVQGIAGLGRTQIALPNQFASHFGLQHSFAVCLGGYGVIFFGAGPYKLLPGVDVSQSINHTPLIINPQGEYYIGVSSININNKIVPFNTSLLSIDRHGFGGTKISTVVPYTVLHTSIYNAVAKAFSDELFTVPKVAPVAPFGLCFNPKNISSTRVGLAVPSIDLVLHSHHVVWRIFGANSMAQVSDNVSCLAFVDGGVRTRASIVIGAHQLEDNLLEFDLSASRLGFSSSLLFRQTTCANFNLTSSA